MDEKREGEEGQNHDEPDGTQDDGQPDDYLGTPDDARSIRDYADIERRIRDGEQVSDEEREAYERVSADLREALKALHRTTTGFKLPDSTREALRSVSRAQQEQLDRIGEQIRSAFSANIDTAVFERRAESFDLQRGRIPSSDETVDENADRPESERLQLDTVDFDSAPVEYAAIFLEMNEYMKQHGRFFERGNEIADLHLEETRRLSTIMDLVKKQSDEQDKFSKRMAWFTLAIGIGTVVIPAWQLGIMLNGG